MAASILGSAMVRSCPEWIDNKLARRLMATPDSFLTR